MRISFCILAAFLASGATFTSWAQPKPGQPAPDFTATDIQGKTHKLGDYSGKIVVLETFSLECPFSANHYKSGAMQALQGAVVNKGVIWLTVNSAPTSSPGYRKPDAAAKEFKSLAMKATAWIDDHSGDLARKYGFKTTPQIFVISQQGLLAYQGAIDDRPEITGYPRTARNFARAAIEALLASKPVATAETKPYGTAVRLGP